MWVTSLLSRCTCTGAFRPGKRNAPSVCGRLLRAYQASAAASTSSKTNMAIKARRIHRRMGISYNNKGPRPSTMLPSTSLKLTVGVL